ncbi:MAG: redoxin domain-containing protein, partial [Flavobacterium sp.]
TEYCPDKPSGDDNFISFYPYDLEGSRKKELTSLAADGSFGIQLPVYFEGDIECSYKDFFARIYVQPGKELILTVNSEKLDRKDLQSGFMISGENAGINHLMLQFASAFSKVEWEKDVMLGDKSLTDSAYAAGKIDVMKEQLAFLDSFKNINVVKDQQYLLWQQNHIIYSAAHDIVFNPFLGKLNATIMPEQLISYLRDININNGSALHNSTYYDFLNSLANAYQFMVNNNPKFDAKKKEYGNNPVPLYMDNIDLVSKGITRQLMYLDLYSTSGTVVRYDAYLDNFNRTITDPVIKTAFAEKQAKIANGFKPFNVLSSLKAFKAGSILTERLVSYFSKQDKNLFIDFWGDWCGPCMREMPNYPQLISAFKEKDIKFVFFSAFTTQQSVVDIQKMYNINGEFINLNNDEIAIMNKVFRFEGYPAHFIMDKNGNVIGNGSGIRTTEAIEPAIRAIRNKFKW